MGSEHPRKVVFIDKRFQMEFILKFLLLMLLGTAVFGVAAYLILDRRLDESYYSAHIAIKSVGELLKPALTWLSLVFMVVFGIASAIITLYVSHHIAGPLYAIRRYLESIVRGDLNFEPRLRTKDQTTPLALTLSQAILTLNHRLVTIRENAEGVRKATEALAAKIAADQQVSQECGKDCGVLLTRTEELIREIEFFQLRKNTEKP